jgi:Kef-type K+ transport system membrane component KefB
VLSSTERRVLAFFSATELPLVVAITTIAIDAEKMHPSTAAGLVGAAMLSTLIFPFIGMALQKRAMAEQDEDPLTPPMIEPLPGA